MPRPKQEKHAAGPNAWTRTLPTNYDPPKLTLILYSEAEVEAALEEMGSTPIYSEVLILTYDKAKDKGADESGNKGTDKDLKKAGSRIASEEEVKAARQEFGGGAKALPGSSKHMPPSSTADKGSALLNNSTVISKKILGKPPSKRPGQTVANTLPPCEQSVNLFFSCKTVDEFASLVEYLQLNGGWFPYQVQQRGACQFASFRRGIDCPAEYTNTHLRRQLIMMIILNKEFFFSLLRMHIAGIYGGKRLTKEEYDEQTAAGTISEYNKTEYHLPGPFSFHSYLKHMLRRTTWGDAVTLTLLSMVFQVRITVITVPKLLSHQVRHSNLLDKTDIVMLHCGENHYSAAVKQTVAMKDGNPVTATLPLAVEPLVKHGNYRMEDEDPSIYSDDDDFGAGFELRREWKDIPLPSKKSDTQAVFDYIAEAQKSHDFHANLLATHNIDACKVYKEGHAMSALENISKEDRLCNLCQKTFASAHTLRAHIRTGHIGQSAHKCSLCPKFYAEASGLKVHMRSHGVGSKIACPVCKKEFDSLGHMNEHKKSHRPASERGDSTCEKCNKVFQHRRNYLQHKERCGKEGERAQCPHCPKNYANRRDLTTHMKKHTEGKGKQPKLSVPSKSK